MRIEWSAAALADLGRFAAFLDRNHPTLAASVARDIIEKAKLLEAHPLLGHPISGHGDYRQIVLRAVNASYVLQYRVDRDRIFVLRAFHGREKR